MSSGAEFPSERDVSAKTLDLKPVRHRPGALSMHPYFGKVDPSIVRWALETYTRTAEGVLDPFCGSGTVLHEAVLSGRNAFGWDSSPLGVMIATGKLLGLTEIEEHEIRAYTRPLFDLLDEGLFGRGRRVHDYEIPPMPRVSKVADWFNENALHELAFLRNFSLISSACLTMESQLLLKLAFSRIITPASLQQGESSYRRIRKPDDPGRVIRLFLQSVETVIGAATAFARLMTRAGLSCKPHRLSFNGGAYSVDYGGLRAETRCLDSRNPGVDVERSQLVVTSPPYLMSWDYGLYHKFRFYWLGLDLDTYEETEVGRHLRRKKDDVERYTADMTAVFSALQLAVRAEGTLVFVNAPSVVYGEIVDTNEVLAQCATTGGWLRIATYTSLDIPGPHHGMYSSLKARNARAPGARGKKEHVSVFRTKHAASTK